MDDLPNTSPLPPHDLPYTSQERGCDGVDETWGVVVDCATDELFIVQALP